MLQPRHRGCRGEAPAHELSGRFFFRGNEKGKNLHSALYTRYSLNLNTIPAQPHICQRSLPIGSCTSFTLLFLRNPPHLSSPFYICFLYYFPRTLHHLILYRIYTLNFTPHTSPYFIHYTHLFPRHSIILK